MLDESQTSNPAAEVSLPVPIPFTKPKRKTKRDLTNLDQAKIDDDMLSYLFIDLWLYKDKEQMCRKMQRRDFLVPPKVNWKGHLDLLDKVKDEIFAPKLAANELMKKAPFIKIMERKNTDQQRNHFLSHLDRYLELCVPDCGFRVFETHRYKPRKSGPRYREEQQQTKEPSIESSAATHQPQNGAQHATDEASEDISTTHFSRIGDIEIMKEARLPPLDLGVKATRDYEVNEYIRLFGSAADLTDEQDDEMRMDTSQLKADFSVLYNNTKDCFQIFMGPGRFVNHDCDNNVELTRSGKNLCFKVVRPIKANEEIFTFYGAEYFGPENESCRCWTCKKNGKGDYTWPKKTAEQKKKEREEKEAMAHAQISTRSGHGYERQSATPVPSPKPVTTVLITSGARQSKRSSTQLASKESIGRAKKLAKTAYTASSGSPSRTGKRRRGEAEVPLSSQPSPKRSRNGHDTENESDLTDIEELGFNWDNESPEVYIKTAGRNIPDLLDDISKALNSVKSDSEQAASMIPIVDENVPSPLSGFYTPEELSSAPSLCEREDRQSTTRSSPSRNNILGATASALFSRVTQVVPKLRPFVLKADTIETSDGSSTTSSSQGQDSVTDEFSRETKTETE